MPTNNQCVIPAVTPLSGKNPHLCPAGKVLEAGSPLLSSGTVGRLLSHVGDYCPTELPPANAVIFVSHNSSLVPARRTYKPLFHIGTLFGVLAVGARVNHRVVSSKLALCRVAAKNRHHGTTDSVELACSGLGTLGVCSNGGVLRQWHRLFSGVDLASK